MKAAVVFQKGELPKYVTDFKEPKVQKENEVLITVKASAVKILTNYVQVDNIIQCKVLTNQL